MLDTRLSRHEAAGAVVTLNELSIRRWELSPMSECAFERLDTLAVADAYCVGVVLAAGLDTTLVTCDAALSRSHGHDVVI